MFALTLPCAPKLCGHWTPTPQVCACPNKGVCALTYGGKSQLKRERPQQFPGIRNGERNERGRGDKGVGKEGRGREGTWQRPRPLAHMTPPRTPATRGHSAQ